MGRKRDWNSWNEERKNGMIKFEINPRSWKLNKAFFRSFNYFLNYIKLVITCV